jgi:hypothetical protein
VVCFLLLDDLARDSRPQGARLPFHAYWLDYLVPFDRLSRGDFTLHSDVDFKEPHGGPRDSRNCNFVFCVVPSASADSRIVEPRNRRYLHVSSNINDRVTDICCKRDFD